MSSWPSPIALLLAAVASAACSDRPLRGSVERSPDGRTYFAIVDDEMGACKSPLFDGKPWTAALDSAVAVAPGPHVLTCAGGDYGFTIDSGTVFRFDYYGP